MFKRNKTLLGLDIGTHSIKAVEMTTAGEGFCITGYGQMDVASEDSKKDVIREIIHRGGFKTKRVVTAVSGRSVIVRYVSMLPMSDENLKNAIRFEADKYIPFEIDEVVLDCQRLDNVGNQESSQEMKVLLVAVKRSLVDEHISLLDRAGLTPVIIDVDSFALGNAFELNNLLSPRVEDKDKVIALIDIGANKTNINIIKGNISYFTREIYLAGNDFTDAISKRLGMSFEEAEALKKNPENRTDEVSESVNPSIDDLANEIHLSFDYFENQFDEEVNEVYLSGGGSRLVMLEEAFERIFDRKTRKWDPTENLEIRADRIDVDLLKENFSQLAIALGLASRLRKV